MAELKKKYILMLDFVFIPLIFPSSKLKTKIIDQVNPELKTYFCYL